MTKKTVKVERELGFEEFARIINNIKSLYETLRELEQLGVDIVGRQFTNITTDMLLMLSSLLNDKDDLLPYYCYQNPEGASIERLWEELTKEMEVCNEK